MTSRSLNHLLCQSAIALLLGSALIACNSAQSSSPISASRADEFTEKSVNEFPKESVGNSSEGKHSNSDETIATLTSKEERPQTAAEPTNYEQSDYEQPDYESIEAEYPVETHDDPFLVPDALPIAIMDSSLVGERATAYDTVIAHLEDRALLGSDSTPIFTSLVQNDRFIMEGMLDGCVDIENPNFDNPEELTEDFRRFFSYVSQRPELITAIPLSAGKTLVSVPCDMFAYQGETANYIYSAGQAIPLHLPVYSVAANGPIRSANHRTVGFQNFDSRTQQLTTFQKYRGMGGCGAESVYQLENDQLTMIQFNEETFCKDDSFENDFPQIYP